MCVQHRKWGRSRERESEREKEREREREKERKRDLVRTDTNIRRHDRRAHSE